MIFNNANIILITISSNDMQAFPFPTAMFTSQEEEAAATNIICSYRVYTFLANEPPKNFFGKIQNTHADDTEWGQRVQTDAEISSFYSFDYILAVIG